MAGEEKGKVDEPQEEEGKVKYVDRIMLKAKSEEDLEQICRQLKADPDIAAGTVDAEKAKLKKKGAFKFKTETSKAVTTTKGTQSLESLINELKLPVIKDGAADIFDAGVSYGIRSLVVAIKIVQELSQIGISQTTPLIKIAQELRQAEGKIAQETGAAMGATMAEKMFDFIDQRLPQPGAKTDIATTPRPMEGMMARTFEMMFNRMQGMMFGVQPGPTPGLVDKRGQGGAK